MSCTSKRKTEMHGNPLLPGSKPWGKHRTKLQTERERVENQEHIIDDAPVNVDIRYEINFDGLRLKEQAQQRRELQNRFLLNHVSYIMQNHGEVDHILKRPMFPGTAYKMNAIQELKRQAKDNTKIVMDLERSYSDYDHVQMAYEWQENRKKKYVLSRYKEDLWKPIFETQKRIQARKGRSLDPFYNFRV